MQSNTYHSVDEWVQNTANSIIAGRRTNGGHPFFRPLTIASRGDETTILRAFSTDISATGIGLLHKRPLEMQQLQLSFERPQLKCIMEVEWCEPCGEGWYLSGGRFLGLSSLRVASFLLAGLVTEFDHCLNQRYPCFQPVTIITNDARCAQMKRHSALTRDISRNGVGLLHNMPLGIQRVNLSIPTATGDLINVRTEIKRCEPCGDEWYFSRGRFRRLVLEELPAMLM